MQQSRARHAKAGYDYPAIRRPFTFSGLEGLSTRIFQAVHDGALAFLVVVSSTLKSSPGRHENACLSAKFPVLTWRSSPVRIRQSPSFFLQSAATIRADDGDNEDEKSHNSDAAEDSEERTDDERYLARLLPSSTIAAIANPATA